jgi:hypothetical protein
MKILAPGVVKLRQSGALDREGRRGTVRYLVALRAPAYLLAAWEKRTGRCPIMGEWLVVCPDAEHRPVAE